MPNINYNLERAFIKGLPKNQVDRMRITKKIDSKLLYPRETAINLMINIEGKLLKISSNERILPKYWDFSNKKIKSNCPGFSELNMVLDKLKTSVLTSLRNAQLSSHRMNLEEVRKLIRDTVNGQQPDVRSVNLLDAYRLFLQEREGQVKLLTTRKYKSLLKTLIDFSKANNIKLCFHHIDQGFEIDFKHYLIYDLHLLNNTIDKKFENLKVFMKWAEEKQYHTTVDYKKYKTQRDESDIIYLTASQVDAIYNLDLSFRKSYDIVRDFFIFSTQVGQRFSDVFNFKWTDIHWTATGAEFHLYQIKGNKSHKLVIPLTDRALEILEKYREREGVFQQVFPAYSNVITNRYLKKIAEMAGLDTPITTVSYNGKLRVDKTLMLWQLVTCHVARRSFVTLSLQNGMRPEVIQQVTGHTDYKVMKRYIKITQSVVSDELLKAWN